VYADATTSFDGNDRPVSSTGFDGTTTNTIYDPLTGRVGATWIDMGAEKGRGTFELSSPR
jgi:hypothetical protein